MTFCEDIGCLNLKWNSQLERHVCDESYPRPDGCPLIEEEAGRIKQRSKVLPVKTRSASQ